MNERASARLPANGFTYSEPTEHREVLQSIGSLRWNRARLARVIHRAIDPYRDERTSFEDAEREA